MSDLWYMLSDSEKYLYHYTRSSVLLDDLIPNMRIRFSSFKDVNDPREYKDFVLGCYGSKVDAYDVGASLESASITLKRDWRVCCFVQDTFEALTTRQREAAGVDVLTAGFHRGHSRPVLWWHYGEKHRGACLVFDRTKLEDAIRNTATRAGLVVHCGAVEYRNDFMLPRVGSPDRLMISIDTIRKLGTEKAARDHMETYWREFFLTKALDWNSEAEFHWLISGPMEGYFYADVSSALRGVIVGDRFPEEHRAKVTTYTRQSEIQFAEMRWQNGVPQPCPAVQ